VINKSSQKIFNNSILYSIGTIATKATAFLLIPIYTYFLSSEEYGVATTITTFVTTFGIVVMLSLRAAIIRFINDYDEEQRPIFVGTILITVLANSLIFCSLLCVFRNFYADIFFKDIDFYPYILIGILSLGCEGVYLVYQSTLQAKQMGGKYSLNSFIYLFSRVIFVIILLVGLKLSVLGVIVANFLTNFLFAIYGIIDMKRKKYIVFSFNKEMFVRSIKYSLPILPHNLANDMNTYSTKIIISNCLNYAISGLYSLAFQFSSMVNLIQSSINLAFRPWFIEQMGEGENGRKQIKYMTVMIMSLFCFISVSVSVFSYEIVDIFSAEEYLEAWKLIPILILSQLITFIYYSHVQVMMYNVKASKFTSISSIVGLATNIIASLILVKLLGVYGIALAQVISKTVLSLIVVIMGARAEKVDFGLKKMIYLLLCAAVLILLSAVVVLGVASGISYVGSIVIRLLIIAIAYFIYIHKYAADFKVLILGLFSRKGKKK